jgi:hypothetical protein
MNYFIAVESGGQVTGCTSLPDWQEDPDGCVAVTEDIYLQVAATAYGATWDGTKVTFLPIPLALAQDAQIDILTTAYQNAVAKPVSYTSKGGTAKIYQADPASIAYLQNALLGCQATSPAAPATPDGFYWVAADNTRVPFTYADLQGLAATVFAQGAEAFTHLQTLKGQVNAATTVSEVVAITW